MYKSWRWSSIISIKYKKWKLHVAIIMITTYPANIVGSPIPKLLKGLKNGGGRILCVGILAVVVWCPLFLLYINDLGGIAADWRCLKSKICAALILSGSGFTNAFEIGAFIIAAFGLLGNICGGDIFVWMYLGIFSGKSCGAAKIAGDGKWLRCAVNAGWWVWYCLINCALW